MSSATEPIAVPRRPDESVATKILRYITKTPLHILLIAIAVLWLIPTIGLFLTSILPSTLFGSQGWWTIFTHPHLATIANYRQVFTNSSITSSLVTTIEITVAGTVLPIIIAALAAYAFAWLEFPGRDWFFLIVVGLLVVPLQMGLIPIFSLYDSLHLYDTVIGIALYHTAFGLPLAVFLLRNFFVGIPRDILESARIDGASELRIFWKLVLPLGLPAIASLTIFQFLWVWNDFLVALTFGRTTQPITVAIFTQLRQFGSNIDLIAPASFVSLLVPLAVFFAFQRYFVQGLLAGSVK
jgi:alpha-glucoside transport system permease protein